MKLPTINLISALSITTMVLAQHVEIGYPPAYEKVSPGQYLTVQVAQTIHGIEGFIHVGLAIGIASCATSPCQLSNQSVGDYLYSGPYNPELHPKALKEYYQNFTVQLPSSLASGMAQLNVALAGLSGGSNYLGWETVNQTLTVVS